MAKFGFGRFKKNDSKVEATKEPQLLDIDAPVSGSNESTELEAPQPYLHLLRQVKNRPNAVAISTPEKDFTFRELFSVSKGIASLLRARGVKPGQLVITAVNPTENLFFMAALFHEAAVGAIKPTSMNQEMASKIDWLVSVAPDPNFPAEKTILIDKDFQEKFELTSLVAQPNVYPSFQSYCRLVFSSGTTGTPKGIPFTIEALEERNRYSRGAWMSEKPFMSLIGMNAVTGFQTAYASLVTGDSFVSIGNSTEALEAIHKHKIRSIKCSPIQLSGLLGDIKAAPEKATSLKLVQTAGSVLPNELARAVSSLLGCKVVNLYGATEVGLIALRPEISNDQAEVGQLVSGAQVEIVSDNGEVLPAGQVGVIRWKRDFMATEYYKDSATSAAAFKDGWFYPGDVGYLTEGKTLFLAGRKDELINVGGVKRDPAMLDEFIKAQPGVQDGASFSFKGPNGIPAFGIALVIPKDFDRDQFTKAFVGHFNFAPDAALPVKQIKRNDMGKVLRAEHARDVEAILAKKAKN